MSPHHGSLRVPASLAASALGLAALALPASSQVASALLREGDGIAALPGQVVTSINNTAVNEIGGYSSTVSTSDGVTSLSLVWGNAAGGAGALIRTEGTIGMYEQTSFETFFGMDDAGQIAYSPLSNDTVGGGTSLDGVWLDDTVLCLEDLPIPTLPGKVWRFGSRPGVTANGMPYWVGGIDDATTGASEGNGLFAGLGATAILKSGDVVAGLPTPISSAGIDFDVRYSAQGSHYITMVDTDATSTADAYMLIDGATVVVSGATIAEGQPIPATSGGMVGENWSSFDSLGINEAGDFMFTGDTGGATTTDEFVAKNGVILYREGDTVDGRVLTGSIESAYMNEAGNIAYVWDVVEGASNIEALYLDDHLILKEGDAVDWDGDGFVDSNAVLTDFGGIASLTMGPDSAIYFTADANVSGTVIEGFFRVQYECLSADVYFLSAASGGTVNLSLDAGPAHAGEAYVVIGSGSGTTPGFSFQGFHVPLNPDPFLNTTLAEANGQIFVNTLGGLDVDGRASAALVVPPLSPSTAGTTVHFAFAAFTVGPIQLTKVSGPISQIFIP